MTPDPIGLMLILGGAGSSHLQVEGFKSVSATMGVERIPNQIEIGITEQTNETTITVLPGMSFVLMSGNQLVMTGWVDRVVRSVNVSHTVTIIGRGKTEDLVDCATKWGGGLFNGMSVGTIAKKLAEPFNVVVEKNYSVKDIPLSDAFPQVQVMPGETPYAIIHRLCGVRALLSYEDEQGRLVLSRTGTQKATGAIEEGGNVESTTSIHSMDERFSEYEVINQGAAFLSDVTQSKALINTTIYDADLNNPKVLLRYRPKVVVPQNGDANFIVAKLQAQWEMARRKGRSTQVHVTVDSWFDSAGVVWRINTLVNVKLPTLKVVDETWLIGEITYNYDDSGSRASLTLMPPQAYQPAPVLYYPLPLDIAQASK